MKVKLKVSREQQWSLAKAASIVKRGENPRNWNWRIRRDFPNEYLEYLSKYDYINA